MGEYVDIGGVNTWYDERRNGESARTHAFLYKPMVGSAGALSWAYPANLAGSWVLAG